jgi:hypothetical protein
MAVSAIPVAPGLTSAARYRTSGLKVLAKNLLLHHEHGREFLRLACDDHILTVPRFPTNTPGQGGLSFNADLAIKELAQTRSLSFELGLNPLALLALLAELVRDIESS